MNKHNYLVIIYKGKPKKKKDNEIIDTIGSKYNTGSGFGFDERDINFLFKSNRSLKSAIKKIKDIKGIEIETYYKDE